MAASGVETALRMLEGRWKMVIIFQLFDRGTLRFSELERAIPGVSQKVLIKPAARAGTGRHHRAEIYPEVPPKVEYKLSRLGARDVPALDLLLEWDGVAAEGEVTGSAGDMNADNPARLHPDDPERNVVAADNWLKIKTRTYNGVAVTLFAEYLLVRLEQTVANFENLLEKFAPDPKMIRTIEREFNGALIALMRNQYVLNLRSNAPFVEVGFKPRRSRLGYRARHTAEVGGKRDQATSLCRREGAPVHPGLVGAGGPSSASSRTTG